METAAVSFSCQGVSPLSPFLPPSSFSVSSRQWQRKKTFYLNKPIAKDLRLRVSSDPECIVPLVSNWGSPVSRVGSVKCLYSSPGSSNIGLGDEKSIANLLRGLSFESIKSSLVNLKPIDICKLCFVLSVGITVSKWIWSTVFNPFVWMYFSWTWLFWPWIVAIFFGIYGLYGLRKHLNGEASLVEQLSIVISTITWLTLVPPAHFNGFLEGWPFVFFLVYHYFFFLSVSVRKRLYGDYYPREHDSKWDISLPKWQTLVFCIGVMAGHWLAAMEGRELHLVSGGWHNVPIWILIVCTIFMQYHSTLYLSKYSEKIVVPTSVVQFGPYRFIRHPIYASTILLFTSYFCALRSPLSIFFTVAVCLCYYGQKAKVEETLLLETFGDRYREYMNRVPYKLIPMVY